MWNNTLIAERYHLRANPECQSRGFEMTYLFFEQAAGSGGQREDRSAQRQRRKRLAPPRALKDHNVHACK